MALKVIAAQAMSEGAGVTVRRSIGSPALRHLDPFLLFDHFASDQPQDYLAGFPDHPHRGFSTVTYMLDGHMQHHDSMGNRGDLAPGSVQWMKAASGIIHSEMPQQESGLMRGFQLWVNLPASEKMSDPAYQEFPCERIPLVETPPAAVRVISGDYGGATGPVHDPHTHVVYLDVELAPQAALRLPLPPRAIGFVYVYEGTIRVAEQPLAQHRLAVLDAEVAAVNADGAAPARFVFAGGTPIGEPIVQYGPFVMNSSAEIEQALRDYRDGRLVRVRARVNTPGDTD